MRDCKGLRKLAVSLILLQLASFAARPGLAPDDLWAWRSVFDPRISPAGDWVLYVESFSDRDLDRAFSNLWIASTDGRARRALTQGNWRDWSPRWSPDGARVAWISIRQGGPQILVRNRDGGAEQQVVRVGDGISTLAWSPGGDAIAFTAFAPAKAPPPVWAPPSIVPRLRRDRQGYIHIFVMPVAGGSARQVTNGDFDHFGEPAWMPDGRSILTVRDDGQIYSVRVADGTSKQLTREDSRNQNPVPSPDGSRIAWQSSEYKPDIQPVRKVVVSNGDGSRVRILTGALDRDAVDLQWSSDSRTVYFRADDRGSTHVYAARADGTVRQVTSAAERLSGFSLADNGRAAVVRSTATLFDNVYTFTVDHASQPVILSDPNEHLMAERELLPSEEIHFPSAGNQVQGWVIKPAGFDAAKKYPLLLDVHDDPREMCGAGFDPLPRVFAARGLVVLCVNTRGTSGFGEVFANLLPARNPGDDFDDLIAGVDSVVSKGYIDDQRVMIMGGPLAAWTIAHSTRFRAAAVRHPPLPLEGPIRAATLVFAGEHDLAAERLYAQLRSSKTEAALVRVGGQESPGESILQLQAATAWLGRW